MHLQMLESDLLSKYSVKINEMKKKKKIKKNHEQPKLLVSMSHHLD